MEAYVLGSKHCTGSAAATTWLIWFMDVYGQPCHTGAVLIMAI